MRPLSGNFGFIKYINELLQSKIALKQTLTLKLGVTLVLTVTQVYVFVIYYITSAEKYFDEYKLILVKVSSTRLVFVKVL